MAVHTRHPVSAPPSAPIREKTSQLLLRAWCIFVLFTAIAASGWNNLLGPIGFGALIAATVVISALFTLLVARRTARTRGVPVIDGRRLPWLALLYTAWAATSLLWSQWPAVTIVTWLCLAATTAQGIFLASVLPWRELIDAFGKALAWVMGLSLVFELWVAIFVRVPIGPLFYDLPENAAPHFYWSRAELFTGGRLQGIVGNSNLLGIAALLAVIVFGLIAASSPRRRVWPIIWMALSLFFVYRAASVTVYAAMVAVVIVLVTTLLMRTADRPRARTKWYVLYAIVAVGGVTTAWVLRDMFFEMFGRTSDLTGRVDIWLAVLERADQRPVLGWGFATPWLPWDPGFNGWILENGASVFTAHNMWVDVYLQLGWIGVALMTIVYLAFTWRAWFFGVDRPRWDLRADRPYSPLSLLPTLTATVLLVQGLAESRPLMEWGWLVIVIFSFKMKQSPHIGVGPAEQSLAIEEGDALPTRRRARRP